MTIVFPPQKIIRSKNIIYRLKIYIYESTASKYPVSIEDIEIGKYSSLKKAEKKMRDSTIKCPGKNERDYGKIHSFSIQEIGVDIPYYTSLYDERIYDDHGKLYGIGKNEREPFLGKPAQDCLFKIGNFVEFLRDNNLHIGIVTGLPLMPEDVERHNSWRMELFDKGKGFRDLDDKMYVALCDQSDNTYTVHYGRKDCTEVEDQEPHLFTPKFPIRTRTRRRLLVKCQYENGVYASYYSENKGYEYNFELNSFMLSKYNEPHVVIFDFWHHLILSLDSYQVLNGNPDKFDKKELDRLIKLIKTNEEDLKNKFHKMVDEHEKRLFP